MRRREFIFFSLSGVCNYEFAVVVVGARTHRFGVSIYKESQLASECNVRVSWFHVGGLNFISYCFRKENCSKVRVLDGVFLNSVEFKNNYCK